MTSRRRASLTRLSSSPTRWREISFHARDFSERVRSFHLINATSSGCPCLTRRSTAGRVEIGSRDVLNGEPFFLRRLSLVDSFPHLLRELLHQCSFYPLVFRLLRLDVLVNHFVYTAVTDGYIVIFG